MPKYLFKRIITLIPVVLGVTILVFLIIHLIPGDPAQLILGENANPEDIAELRNQLGLNQSILTQFTDFISNLLKADLGTSFYYKKPVLSLFAERFINTFILTGISLLISIIFSIPLGIVTALKRGKKADKAVLFFSIISVSMPVFWLGPLLIIVFSIQLNIFPISGFESISSIVLPAITLGFGITATNIRIVRSSMIEVMNQAYILAGIAKGLSRFAIIVRHALKNVLIPLVTILGLQLGALLGGAVITEVVFSFPGVGRLLILGILRRDYPLVQGVILLIALIYILINLVTDIIYAILDPKIKYD